MSSSELVFCHACQNEWHREEHGLQCPQCHSDFVELVEPGHDPRDNHDESDHESPGPEPEPNLLHGHPPWAMASEAPDPDEGDIEHVEWHSSPTGLRVTRTSIRSGSPGMGPGGPNLNDPFAPIFQTFSSMLAGSATPGLPRGPPITRLTQRQRDPRAPEPIPLPGGRHSPRPGPWNPNAPSFAPTSPLQEGPGRHGFGGSRHSYTATARVFPRDANNTQSQNLPVDELHDLPGLIGTILQNMQHMHQGPQGEQARNVPVLPFAMLAQMLNPANAAHGDAVYTQEALDRVISHLMEQQNGHSAPGPASAAAISALPKKQADKSMMGSDGKAECSVCMDNVEIGDEVTVLPCGHWFHGDCVGAWLKEHDTCPHCRQGIMPKEGEANAPRTPSQAPRNSQSPLTPTSDGSRANPFRIPGTPPATRPEASRWRSSAREGRSGREGSSSGGGGLTGWMRNRFGGGGSEGN